MKKILSILGVIAITASTASVEACSYVPWKTQSIKNKIEELIKVANVPLKAAMAGKAGTDGAYAYNYLSTKMFKNADDQISESTSRQMINSYFGGGFSFSSLGKVAGGDDVASFNGNKFSANSFETISGLYSAIYAIVGKGLSPDLARSLCNLISGIKLVKESSVATIDQVVGALSTYKDDVELKNVTKVGDYMNVFYAKLSGVLAILAGDASKTLSAESISTMTKTNLIKAYGDSFKVIFKKVSVKSSDIGTLIKSILVALCSLGKYIESFEPFIKYDDSNKLNDDQLNHLFSKTKVNVDAIAETENNLVDENKKNFSLKGIIDLFWAFIKMINNKSEAAIDPYLQLLFQTNSSVNSARIFSTPKENDDTANPVYNTSKDTDGALFSSKKGFLSPLNFSAGYWMDADKYNRGLVPVISSVFEGLFSKLIGKNTSTINLVMKIIGLSFEGISSGISNLISYFLANNNASHLISKLTTDIYGLGNLFLKTSINVPVPSIGEINIGKILGITSIPTELEPVLSSFTKFLAPIMERPITNLFTMNFSNTYKSILSYFDTMSLYVPKSISTNIEGYGLSVFAAESDTNIMNLLIPLFDMLVSQKQSISKIGENIKKTDYMSNIKDIQNAIGVSKIENGSFYVSQGSDRVKVSYNISLALFLLNDNYKGWKIITKDNTVYSAEDYGSLLLGYDNEENEITDGSILSNVSDMFEGENGDKMQQDLSDIKKYISSMSENFVAKQNAIVDKYVDDKNFTYKNKSYKNFENSAEKSTLSYDMYYKYGDNDFRYHIVVELNPGKDSFYKFTKIEQF